MTRGRAHAKTRDDPIFAHAEMRDDTQNWHQLRDLGSIRQYMQHA